MQGNLLSEFDKILDEEAERIVAELIVKYRNQEVINKPFGEIVRSLIREEFKGFEVELELRTEWLIPRNYIYDRTFEHTLMTLQEFREDHLLRYSENCRKELGYKDHIKQAKLMAPKLIKFANDNPTTEKSFGELVNGLMKEHFPQHYDSVDTRTIIMFLQSDFENNGYVATSLKPFRISKK